MILHMIIQFKKKPLSEKVDDSLTVLNNTLIQLESLSTLVDVKIPNPIHPVYGKIPNPIHPVYTLCASA